MEYITETFIPYAEVLVPLLIEGLKVTIYVSAASFALSIVLGALLAVIQHFKIKGLNQLAKIYISYFVLYKKDIFQKRTANTICIALTVRF